MHTFPQKRPISTSLLSIDCQKNYKIPSHRSFNGKEKDPESGFHYYGARYYWSELLTGWLSVDPMADKYPGISPYNYCMWNPVTIIDPDGQDTIISYNTQKPYLTKIKSRTDLGGYKEKLKRYEDNKAIASYARNNYKEPSDIVHVFMHGDPSSVELGNGESFGAKELYMFIFSKSPHMQYNEINNNTSLVVLHSCSTGQGETSIAQQLSQESSSLIVMAPSDLLSSENGGETVLNNGKWNVYKGGRLVRQYEGTYRTPEQMKKLAERVQNELQQ